MLYNINELKIGLKVLQNKEPCIILSNECIKPGKGQSFNRLRFRKIMSGQILEKTLKSGDYLESADVIESKLVYVYRDMELWYFMNTKNFEQIGVHSDIIGSGIKWMIEHLYYIITFWNNIPILVIPPDYVQLKVTKTISVVKNVSTSSGTKLVTVSTGAIIKVPYFIKLGEWIKINTNSGEYVSRIK